MTLPASSPNSERARRATLVWTALAALVYAMTWQDTLHGTDWRWFVIWLDEPDLVHAQHPGYLAVARGLRWLLSPLGLDAYGVLRVVSILGGAITVGGIHRLAVATGGDARNARIAAVLAIASPALWHHATVVELHAPFAAVMVWAAVFAVRLVRDDGPPRAVFSPDLCLLGLLSGAATVMHATGHLLVLVFGLAILWRAPVRGWRWSLRAALAFAVLHAVTWGVLFALLRLCGELPEQVQALAAQGERLGSADNPLDYLLQWWRGMDFGAQIGPTVVCEWLESFAPFSVLVLVGLFVRRLRAAVLLLLLALVVYLVATVALVHAWTDERGAYLLPLLPPALLLTMQLVPRRWWYVLLASTFLAGALLRGEPGREPPDRVFGAAAAAMAAQQPTVFFVADLPEMDGAFLANPRLDLLVGRKERDDLTAVQQQTGREPTPEQVAAWLTMLAAEAKQKGARLVVTDRAVEWMSGRVEAFVAGWTAFAASAPAARLGAETGIAGYVVR